MSHLGFNKFTDWIRQTGLIIALCCPIAACASAEIEWELVETLQHEPDSWTQGLLYTAEGRLLESSGWYQKSFIRQLDPDNLRPILTRRLPGQYFAEGIAVHRGELFLLTWQENVALVLDPVTFKDIRNIPIEGEGWGLTSDGTKLWMSNGSDQLRVIDPQTGSVLESLSVTLDNRSLAALNELEWIEGSIYANRWYDNNIYRIDPDSGVVTATIDLSELARLENGQDRAKVMNGIAWDSVNELLLVTGKYWGRSFKLRLNSVH